MRVPLKSAVLPLLLAACGTGQAPQQPQAMPVETYTVGRQDVPYVIELPGRVEPVRVAEVRARVTGILQRRLYEEGTDVAAGQPLFLIDPAELRAGYAQTEASLQRAQATAANARAVVERYRPLVRENAVSGQEYDAAVAAAREADANVAQTRAQLRASGLQLGYTTVRAPIAGRASRVQVTEGALVSQAEGTLLTRIEQMDPIYVTFSQSASALRDLRARLASGDLRQSGGGGIEVRVELSDGTEYSIPGHIDFLDYSVDQTTGTVVVRAEFANPQRLLLPGEFVRARVYAGTRPGGIMVPQRAVSISDTGSTVFVIDGKGQVAVRPVTLGDMVDGKWIIESGLNRGDVVITSNLQMLRPGMPVTPIRRPAAQQQRSGNAPANSANGAR